MAASVTVERVYRDGRTLHVFFSDGTSLEFASRKQARQHVENLLSDARVLELLKAIAVAAGLRISADADDVDDLDLLVGKTFTFTRKAANVVRVT